jgi:hypothetical protein
MKPICGRRGRPRGYPDKLQASPVYKIGTYVYIFSGMNPRFSHWGRPRVSSLGKTRWVIEAQAEQLRLFWFLVIRQTNGT